MNKFNLYFLVVIVFFSTGLRAQWSTKPVIPQAQTGRGGASSFVLNNSIYVLGGYVGFTAGYTNDMFAFNTTSGTWSSKASPVEANRTGGVSAVINNKAYVALGVSNYLSINPTPVYLTDVNEYNETNNTWTNKAAFPAAGRIFSASFVLNNKWYVAGGATSGAVSNEVWQYDPATDTWTQKANLPVALESAKGFASTTKGYLVGGLNSSAVSTNKTYEYDPVADTWTSKADMPVTGIQGGTVFTIGNTAYYALGSDKDLGQSGAQFPKAIYAYAITSNTWSTTSYQFPGEGRMWPISGVINNKAYMGCGYKFASGEFAYRDLHELSLNPSAIHETTVKDAIRIFPNPVKHQFYIQHADQSQFALYDLSGRLMMQVKTTSQSPIDISHLPNGMYLLYLEGFAAQQAITLIKE